MIVEAVILMRPPRTYMKGDRYLRKADILRRILKIFKKNILKNEEKSQKDKDGPEQREKNPKK